MIIETQSGFKRQRHNTFKLTISFQSTGSIMINGQYHFKIQTNGRNTCDVH